MDIKTLQYWHKLEHFYPYILQEQKNKFISTYLFKDNSAFLDYDTIIAFGKAELYNKLNHP